MAATSTIKYNNIYGNLASREFPLVDGNYVRIDRYPTRDGRKVRLEIYPAYDLKSETNSEIDPGFANLGSEYTLKPGSPLAKMQGVGQRHIGAYAPSRP